MLLTRKHLLNFEDGSGKQEILTFSMMNHHPQNHHQLDSIFTMNTLSPPLLQANVQPVVADVLLNSSLCHNGKPSSLPILMSDFSSLILSLDEMLKYEPILIFSNLIPPIALRKEFKYCSQHIFSAYSPGKSIIKSMKTTSLEVSELQYCNGFAGWTFVKFLHGSCNYG